VVVGTALAVSRRASGVAGDVGRLPRALYDAPAHALKRWLGARGPAINVATACASGHGHGIGPELLPRGKADMVVAGGYDASRFVLRASTASGRSPDKIRPPPPCRPPLGAGARPDAHGRGPEAQAVATVWRDAGAQPARERMRGRIVEGARQPADVARERPLALSTPPSAVPTTTARRSGPREEAARPPDSEVVRGGDEQSAGPANRHARPLDGAGELLDLAAVADAKVVHREALDMREMPSAPVSRRPKASTSWPIGCRRPARIAMRSGLGVGRPSDDGPARPWTPMLKERVWYIRNARMIARIGVEDFRREESGAPRGSKQWSRAWRVIGVVDAQLEKRPS